MTLKNSEKITAVSRKKVPKKKRNTRAAHKMKFEYTVLESFKADINKLRKIKIRPIKQNIVINRKIQAEPGDVLELDSGELYVLSRFVKRIEEE